MNPRHSTGVLLIFLLVIGGWRLADPPSSPRNEHLVMSVLWVQTSAEFRALCYQAFNTAQERLSQHSRNSGEQKRRAVVVDIDETVLDNSPHMAKLIRENEVFPFAWTEWVNRAEADPLPGSREFLKHADSLGYDIFYVSNRTEQEELEGTIRNLKQRGFPQVEQRRLLLKTKESGKEKRRRFISETHEIVLLVGDNLNDMAEIFERKSVADRSAATDEYRQEFGKKFIVLPNPMYGEWEGAVYGYNWAMTDEQKDKARKSALKAF